MRAGSIIHDDQWASYLKLGNRENVQHGTVGHKYHFVCPETGVHTQHVKSLCDIHILKINVMVDLNDAGHD